MNELKTLKDIDLEIADICEESRFPIFTDQIRGNFEHKLKQEVIKWIKADKSNYYSRQGKEETILWIKHFFNLTDEDLV